MKSPTLVFVLLLLLLLSATGQNNTICDSVVIECCKQDSLLNNNIVVTATNNSSYLFPYPGFILFNDQGDTIAVENVNYFGIGTFPQDHSMSLSVPIMLPFSGYLNLYSGFGDSLHCTFPVNLPDTTVGFRNNAKKNIALSVFPNPSYGPIYIEIYQTDQLKKVVIELFDVSGQLFYTSTTDRVFFRTTQDGFSPGIYFIRITDQSNNILSAQKIILK